MKGVLAYIDDILVTGPTIEEHLSTLDKVLEKLVVAGLRLNYYGSKPLVLACDVSQYSLGTVLSHLMEDGKDRLVAYAFRRLTLAEKNYSQVEKEGLAIILALKSFTVSSLADTSLLNLTIHPCLTCSMKPKECPRQHHLGSRVRYLPSALTTTLSDTNQG